MERFATYYKKLDESIFVPLDIEQKDVRKQQFYKTLDRKHTSLYDAARIGWADRVKEHIDWDRPTEKEIKQSFSMAAQKGHLDVVKILWPYAKRNVYRIDAAKWAAYYNRLDVVKYVIENMSASDINYDDIMYNALEGHATDVVKYMIGLKLPMDYSYLLTFLANTTSRYDHGNDEIFALLKPLADPETVKQLIRHGNIPDDKI